MAIPMEVVQVKRLDPDAVLPQRSHPRDAGMDLFSVVNITIMPGRPQLVGTGIAIALPAGTEAQIRPRSGLALNNSISVLNSPGTIDCGYRGEVGVILFNHGALPFDVRKGMRIAQLVVAPVLGVCVELTDELEPTSRGEDGFGSTGK